MKKNLYPLAILLLIVLIPFFLGAITAHAAEPAPAPPASGAAAAPQVGVPTFLSLGATNKGKPVKALVRTAWPIRAQARTDLVVQLWTDDGPIAPTALKPYYGVPLHLFLLSPDFKEFYHLAPFATQNAGEYRVNFLPRTQTPLRAWLEFMTDEGLKMAVTDVNFEEQTVQPLQNKQVVQITAGGLKFSIDFDDELLVGKPVNGMMIVTESLSHRSYKELEPLMGAFGHAVAFGPGFLSINHVQPLGAPPAGAESRGGPAIYFRYTPTEAGMNSFFGMFRIHGRDVVVPFVVRVAATSRKVRGQDLENKSRPEHQDPVQK